jgi:SNF2 family DNA or RNA helicase
VDPADPEATYQAIDMLDPDLTARLVKQTVPCPACGGKREVPRMVRIAREVPCPKDAALKMLLDENEEVGRVVIFAGFTGSVDRIVKLCLKEKWDVVRCDQGNFQVFTAKSDSSEGAAATEEEPLDYWANLERHGKVAFVANPESGGMSLTLVEARMAVYWSNSWKPEFRVQSEDRIHRKGMDENLGCTIVDLIHLPSDDRVLEVIRANRKLELMTMGELLQGVDWKDAGEEGEMQVEEAAL